VKPPAFEYHAPETIDDALQLLAHGDGVRVLAGGQSLVQLLKFRTIRPRALVDINGVGGLDTIEERGGELHVGALVRQQTLLEDEAVARVAPLLREAVQYVGYRATRHRGTVGGSLAFAAPWAELTAAVVALDAAIDVRSTRSTRSIPARSFFLGANETALEAGELVTGVRVPVAAAATGFAFQEVSVRYRDYAQVGAAAVVRADDSAELVLLRVAPTPFHVSGNLLDDGVVEAALAAIDPPDDVEATSAYRKRVAPVLARRALAQAAERRSA
jgi:aerobic carbon-monoxide dehydrogenase medium subunit